MQRLVVPEVLVLSQLMRLLEVPYMHLLRMYIFVVVEPDLVMIELVPALSVESCFCRFGHVIPRNDGILIGAVHVDPKLVFLLASQ